MYFTKCYSAYYDSKMYIVNRFKYLKYNCFVVAVGLLFIFPRLFFINLTGNIACYEFMLKLCFKKLSVKVLLSCLFLFTYNSLSIFGNCIKSGNKVVFLSMLHCRLDLTTNIFDQVTLHFGASSSQSQILSP